MLFVRIIIDRWNTSSIRILQRILPQLGSSITKRNVKEKFVFFPTQSSMECWTHWEKLSSKRSSNNLLMEEPSQCPPSVRLPSTLRDHSPILGLVCPLSVVLLWPTAWQRKSKKKNALKLLPTDWLKIALLRKHTWKNLQPNTILK